MINTETSFDMKSNVLVNIFLLCIYIVLLHTTRLSPKAVIEVCLHILRNSFRHNYPITWSMENKHIGRKNILTVRKKFFL